MHRDKKALRSAAFNDFKNHRSLLECFNRLKITFGDLAPSIATVRKYFREFRAGRTDLEDRRSSGGPATAVTPATVSEVQRLIKLNPRGTCEWIEQELGIGSSALQVILHRELKVRKVCARWVPHKLSEDQKQTRKDFSEQMLEIFSKNPEISLKRIITEDETWSYCYDPLTKRMSME